MRIEWLLEATKQSKMAQKIPCKVLRNLMLLVPSSHSCLDSNSLADLVARRCWRSIIEKGKGRGNMEA